MLSERWLLYGFPLPTRGVSNSLIIKMSSERRVVGMQLLFWEGFMMLFGENDNQKVRQYTVCDSSNESWKEILFRWWWIIKWYQLVFDGTGSLKLVLLGTCSYRVRFLPAYIVLLMCYPLRDSKQNIELLRLSKVQRRADHANSILPPFLAWIFLFATVNGTIVFLKLDYKIFE